MEPTPSVQLKVISSPSHDIAFTNKVAIHPDVAANLGKYVLVKPRAGKGREFAFCVLPCDKVKLGCIAVNLQMREWALLDLDEDLPVRTVSKPSAMARASIKLVPAKGKTSNLRLDSGEIEAQFKQTYNHVIFTTGQYLVMNFRQADGKKHFLKATIGEMHALDLSKMFRANTEGAQTSQPAERAILSSETLITFESEDQNKLMLSGKSRKRDQQSLFASDWSFQDLGVGGLDAEFDQMFRVAFTSRVLPEINEMLGQKHVKGILMYGPPGCGKTLIATKIGKMLRGHEPKVVRGPEILSKYVGEAEENIRELFASAYEEYEQLGEDSQTHVIIFDEIDAICKKRGTTGGGTGVEDRIVNQLLSLIDGPKPLNNILVIGMTNRPDLIDDALTRPGRLELKLEIGLPDEAGRKQIFTIHTSKMKESNCLADDVELDELAALSKNYTGAEIAAVCRGAGNRAQKRYVKYENGIQIDREGLENFKVFREDFLATLEELKPQFGVSDVEYARFLRNGIIEWGLPVDHVLEQGRLLVEQVKSSPRTPLVSALLTGPPGSGKTALAARIAKDSGFSFIKVVSSEDIIGFSEQGKIEKIKTAFDDADRTDRALIILDDIERLLSYVALGNLFSNPVLQTLLILIKRQPREGHRLLVLATTANKAVLDRMGLSQVFSTQIHCDTLTDGTEVMNVLEALQPFSGEDMKLVKSSLSHGSKLSRPETDDQVHINVAIKKLYMLVEMARQKEHGAGQRFLEDLYDESRFDGTSLPSI